MQTTSARKSRRATGHRVVAALLGILPASAAMACGGPVIDGLSVCYQETVTTTSSRVNPTFVGQTATFDIVVTATNGGGLPSGSIDILDGTNVIDSIALAPSSSGTSSVSVSISSLSAGIHGIAAKYISSAEHTIGSVGSVAQLVGDVCHVMQGTAGPYNGYSWDLAYADLQSALSNPGCREIWVARGTYTPSTVGDVAARFDIGHGVAVYGGFAGTETQRDQRDARANPTLLSGDLGGGVNSYHVVWMDGTTSAGKIDANTVLDGFTITGGDAHGNGRDDSGGGLTCAGDGAGHGCSPTLRNLRFTNNHARFGGAMLLEGSNGGDSSPSITNVTFDGNAATSDGGAVYNSGYAGSSYPSYGNVTFFDNSAGGRGGAAFNDFRNGGSGNTAFVNVTFSGNHAGTASGGGAVYSSCGAGNYGPNSVLINTIAWDDTAAGVAHEVGGDCVYPPTVNYAAVEGGCPFNADCTNVSAADPLLGALQDNGGLAPTLQPGSSGAAIGTGNAAVCAAAPVYNLDQRGVARPQMGVCDIGAVELTDRIFSNSYE